MKKKFRKWFIPVFIIGGLITVFVLIAIVNLFLNWGLRGYAKKYTPVEYTDRLEPEMIDGHYTFTTDEDIKIMHVTDLHLGGGFLSYNKDKQAINSLITMLQNEKPDLLILTGDNTFAVPYISGTINDKMVVRTVIKVLEHMGVYYATVFGNHDTECYSYFNRKSVYKLYCKDKWEYSLCHQEFNGYGETNQIINVRRTDGLISKSLVLLDSNSYQTQSIKDVLDWDYDYIHDEEIDWAVSEIKKFSESNKNILYSMTEAQKSALDLSKFETVKSMLFIHIPVSEYEIAYRELVANNLEDTTDSKFVGGVWDEIIEEKLGGRVWYGGWSHSSGLGKEDNTFEKMTEASTLEAILCGHDHTNNADVMYKGVLLSYGYSIDCLAYTDINEYGLQRGCQIITISPSGEWTKVKKNLYMSGYTFEKTIKTNVDISKWYYDDLIGEE